MIARGFLLTALFWGNCVFAGEVTVAVASNFMATAEKLAAAFEEETGHEVLLSNGSTGLLYSQIASGAPIDIFLAADEDRPRRLADEGKAIETRTYAVGTLVLLSREAVTTETAAEVFQGKTVALADPTVAPYGRAATAAMERLALDTATFRPVMVANVGQVAAIFATGTADLAFVAASVRDLVDAPFVLSLDGVAPEIRQDAALLTEGEASRALWNWLAGAEASALIEADGYRVP